MSNEHNVSGSVDSDESIRPYRIDIPTEVLHDVRRRLDATRWAHSYDPTSWEDGTSAGYLQELVEYWRTEYDWPFHQHRLNSYPQYTTVFDGHRVHFVWLRSSAIHRSRPPVIMTHGWPGSFIEFLRVAKELAADGHDVVIPSIPGFGFPGPPSVPWTFHEVTLAWAELMRRLNYTSYYAHGGDIGSAITRHLGLIDSGRVLGVHVTSATGGVPTVEGRAGEEIVTGAERAALRYASELSAYAHLHATRPLSVSHALSDSPSGLLGWIAERFHDWTEAAVTGRETVDRAELITNTMIFWLNNTTTSAATFYKTNGFYGRSSVALPYSATPMAVSVFGHDILISDRVLGEKYNNITQWTEHSEGGHFPGLEVPHLLVADIRAAFSP